MDAQGLAGCFLFPTLGVGVEEALLHDPGRVARGVPRVQRVDARRLDLQLPRAASSPRRTSRLQDPARAEAEVEYALEHGAQVVVMRAGPVRGPGFSRSPGDRVYDRVWARLAEAGILVAYHSGDAGYGRYADEWGGGGDFQAFRNDPFRQITERPPADLRHHRRAGVSRRAAPAPEPARRDDRERLRLGARVAARVGEVVRTGPGRVRTTSIPSQQVREHVWVSPYYEDDLPVLRDELGADRMIFGSDYPHAEGLADPLSFVDDLPGFSDDEVRLVMRENALALSVPRT